MTPRSDSASSRSPRAVEPATSEKTTVIVLRWSGPLGVCAASGAAQARQNRAISGFSWPQMLQTAMLRVYAAGRVSTSGLPSVALAVATPDPQMVLSELEAADRLLVQQLFKPIANEYRI